MAKNSAKATYTLTELGEIVMRKFPGHYKDIKNAASTVSYFANRLEIKDINGKKKFKHIAAADAEKIIATMRESYETHPKTWTTPIEREIRKADKVDVAITENEPPTLPVLEVKAEKVTPEMRAELKEAMSKMPGTVSESEIYEIKPDTIPSTPVIRKTAEEKKAEADEFARKRKHFYTDVNYFMRLAQTPAERVAIWEALSNLYGIVTTYSSKILPDGFEDESDEQHDKWSI